MTEKLKKKEKIIEINSSNQSEKEKYNKTLRAILIFVGIIVFLFFAILYIADSKTNFEYKGVEYRIIQEGKLTLYNTQVPIYSKEGEKINTYNFYMRNDPRTLENLSFGEGIPKVRPLLVLNYSSDIDCKGYGVIALTNLINLYELVGVKVVKDVNATCDKNGRYLLFNIQEANQTKIEEIGKDCYFVQVANCEILAATEKLMVETFITMKEANVKVTSSA
jgi:hypothetical protein